MSWIIKARHIIIVFVILAVLSSVVIVIMKNRGDAAATTTSPLSLTGMVTQEQVDDTFGSMPDSLKEKITKDDVADALAGQKLLLDEADKKGIAFSDEEVDGYIGQLTSLRGISEEEFREEVEGSGLDYQDYKEKLKESIIISKLIEEEVGLKSIKATDGEVDAFIKNNGELEELEEYVGADGLRAMVKRRLTSEKQNEAITEYIQGLKS